MIKIEWEQRQPTVINGRAIIGLNNVDLFSAFCFINFIETENKKDVVNGRGNLIMHIVNMPHGNDITVLPSICSNKILFKSYQVFIEQFAFCLYTLIFYLFKAFPWCVCN